MLSVSKVFFVEISKLFTLSAFKPTVTFGVPLASVAGIDADLITSCGNVASA